MVGSLIRGRWATKICQMCLLLGGSVGIYCIFYFNLEDYSLQSGMYTPLNFSYTLKPFNSCMPNEGPELLIVVISKPGNHHIRKAIRSTWGNTEDVNVKVLFLLGMDPKSSASSIEEEHRIHNDVIQANFRDSYRNLTLKSLLMLQWVSRYCPVANFLLKSDDDAFVNVPCLLQLTKKISQLAIKGVLVGRHILQREVVRDPYNKWFVPKHIYNADLWPVYLRGTTYIANRAAFSRMSEICWDFSAIPMEDVVLTGICAESLNIPRLEVPSFHLFQHEIKDPCLRDTITVAEVSVDDMHRLHDVQRNCSRSEENRTDSEEQCKISLS